MQEARAEGEGTIVVKGIDAIKSELNSAVGEFLNANALNKKEGGKWKVSEETDSSKVAKVYFGGNEYYIVNADEENKIGGERVVTLAARKGYESKTVRDSSYYNIAEVLYEDSNTEKYLTGEKDGDFLQKFGAGRKLEIDSVVAKKIYTGVPYTGQSDNNFIVNAEMKAVATVATESTPGVYESNQKFYLMGGLYKGYTDETKEKYAYAGDWEDQQAGYAVRCSLFGRVAFWLRSAFCDLYGWYVGSVTPVIGYVVIFNASYASAVAPACNLALSHIIFASDSASGKNFLEKSAALEGDKKIELTLLDDGKSGTDLPSDVAGEIVVSGNTATFTKTGGTDLSEGQYLALVCKDANGDFSLVKGKAEGNGDYTFDLTGKDGNTRTTDITEMSVVVCKDNKGENFADGCSSDGYNVRYARAVSTDLNEHADWGKMEKHGGITHYVDAKGMTSVEISAENTDANGIVWLREESAESYAWYGVDNSSGIFENGSRFWVRWLNKETDKEDWDAYYADLDEKHKAKMDEAGLWIFLVGVTKPDGKTPYENFDDEVNLYVQLDGKEWGDMNEIKALYISGGTDEIVDVQQEDGIEYPEGEGKFAKLVLKHFSPYAVYDAEDSKTSTDTSEKTNPSNVVTKIDLSDLKRALGENDESEANSVSNKVSTGENSRYFIIFSLMMLLSSFAVLKSKKKRDV